jgi:hypothetical protein
MEPDVEVRMKSAGRFIWGDCAFEGAERREGLKHPPLQNLRSR